MRQELCGACVRACPSQLLPHELDSAARRLDLATLDRDDALCCIECGCCAYVCPSKRHLVQNIIIGKDLLLSVQKKGRTD
jgi:electron transport complex protein RnfC